MRLRLPAPRTLALLAVLVPLLGLFGQVVLRSGPLAPVPVTVGAVELRLIAPALFGIGTVEARFRYPIGPVVAGQPVVEVIDPASLWVNTRFDQLHAAGLAPGLSARIALRAQPDQPTAGTVARVEPLADGVTEELLAKIAFEPLPDPLPRVNELAEVTLALPPLAAAPTVINAALHRVDGRLGVWVIEGDGVRFAEVRTGAADLDGWIQVLEGLQAGQRVALHSPRALGPHSRIQVVERLAGVKP